MNGEEFIRAFAQGFGAGDAAALAALMAEGGTALTLTGQWAEGKDEVAASLAAEFAGIFARARLVTGKGSARSLFPGCFLVRQRFVITGASDESGNDIPRIGAVLVAVLGRDGVENLTFSALT